MTIISCRYAVEKLFFFLCSFFKYSLYGVDRRVMDEMLNRIDALERVVVNHDSKKENPDFRKLTRGAG